MPTSPLTSTPYPQSFDIPDGANQMGSLVGTLEKYAIPRFGSTAARDAAITAPATGQCAWAGTILWCYTGAVWTAVTPLVFADASARDATITSPQRGMQCLLLSTGEQLVYYGATTGWQKNWAIPWGNIATRSTASNQTGITTVVDVTSLTATWTPIANRIHRYSVHSGGLFQNTSNAIVDVLITDGSNTILRDHKIQANATTWQNVAMIEWETPAAGSITRKVRIQTSAGTADTNASATLPFVFVVEDMGPSGNMPSS